MSARFSTHLLNLRFGLVTPTPTPPALPTLPFSFSPFCGITTASSSSAMIRLAAVFGDLDGTAVFDTVGRRLELLDPRPIARVRREGYCSLGYSADL